MIQELNHGRGGYDVPCLHNLTGGERSVCVVSHGFGGSKASETTALLAHALQERGTGVFAFDFPAHGDSPVDGAMLSTSHCMDDLALAEERALALAPRAEICYFSSSFGAYINLLYLATRPHAGRRSFLRSAAVEMPRLFHHKTPEELSQLEDHGYLMLDLGFVRPLKLTREFFQDLDRHDLFQLCRKGMAELAMVHGGRDDLAAPEAARRFARQFGAALTILPGGDHRLADPVSRERVLRLAAGFFAGL